MTRFDVRDVTGELFAIHKRIDRGAKDKNFFWLQPDGTPGLNGRRVDSLPLYGSERVPIVPKGGRLVLAEGEKAADALNEKGMPALGTVTGAGGTPGDAPLSVTQSFEVFLWPDNDDAGREHMRRIAVRLHALGIPARVVSWADAGPGEDAADFIARGGTTEQLAAILDGAQPWTADTPAGAPGASGDEAEIDRLAELPRLEYERVRKEAAKNLGMRSGELDREVRQRRGSAEGDEGHGHRLELPDPEPWPDPVEGTAALEAAAGAFRRYLAMPLHAIVAAVLWAVHAHVLAVSRATFEVSPRLLFTSPTPRCGKTTALTLMQQLVPRALNAASVTAAAIFRTIDVARPTLLIDEGDALFSGEREDLRALFNAGQRAGCGVIRVVGDEHEPRSFDVFGPVALAAIGRLPGTVEDRSIVLEMRRRRPGERVQRMRIRDLGYLRDVNRMLSRWARDNAAALAEAAPAMPDALDDRAGDNWLPLLAIADAIGGDWPSMARSAAVELSGGRDEGEGVLGVRLLRDIRGVFEAHGVDKVASKDLADALAAVEGAPWAEWGRRERPISPAQLSRLLRPFGVAPGTIRLPDGSTPKGYRSADFADAFARYLESPGTTLADEIPDFHPPQRHNRPESAPEGAQERNPDPPQAGSVADRDSGSGGHVGHPNAHCGSVAFRSGEKGGAGTICGDSEHRRGWRSIHGVLNCALCHPPADPALVAAWTNGA